jgi:NitT/TauT family transport system ATP-binding protein
MAIEPLPSTGISSIVKLCEAMAAHSGPKEMLAVLPLLRMPFDELLLVSTAAEMLGLVDLHKKTLVLTPLGRQLVEAPAAERKALLKQQLMKLKVFQHVVKLINKSKDQVVPAEVIRETLAVLLPHEQPRNLFATLLNWGRYGQVFSYARDSDTFHLVASREASQPIAIPPKSK